MNPRNLFLAVGVLGLSATAALAQPTTPPLQAYSNRGVQVTCTVSARNTRTNCRIDDPTGLSEELQRKIIASGEGEPLPSVFHKQPGDTVGYIYCDCPPIEVTTKADRAAMSAGPPPLPVPPSSIPSQPIWVSKPGADQLEQFYPALARDQKVSGSATVDCDVSDKGQLLNCIVIAETPGGMGFGEATLKLMDYFQMAPLDAQGRPVGGARIRVPITWRLG